MGRPINKKHFGAQTSSSEGDYPNIPVEAAFIGGEMSIADPESDIFIVKQKSARRFLVESSEDGEQALCKLVDKAGSGDDSTALGLSEGEMVITGVFVDENGDTASVTIQKMTNLIAVDFNNQRYKWTVDDDSTSNQLLLTEKVGGA